MQQQSSSNDSDELPSINKYDYQAIYHKKGFGYNRKSYPHKIFLNDYSKVQAKQRR